MIRRICATDDSAATAILRVVLGIVFFAHGAQKILGAFANSGVASGALMVTRWMISRKRARGPVYSPMEMIDATRG